MTAAHFRKTVFSSSSSSITRSRGHAALPRLAVLELGVCGGHLVQLQQRVALLHTKVFIKLFKIYSKSFQIKEEKVPPCL